MARAADVIDEPAAMDEPAFSATCARCGVRFQCGVDAPDGCWCMRVPVLPADRRTVDAGCLCEACLRALLAAAPADAQPSR